MLYSKTCQICMLSIPTCSPMQQNKLFSWNFRPFRLLHIFHIYMQAYIDKVDDTLIKLHLFLREFCEMQRYIVISFSFSFSLPLSDFPKTIYMYIFKNGIHIISSIWFHFYNVIFTNYLQLIQSLKCFTFPFFHSLTVHTPCVQRAFTVCSPYTNHSQFCTLQPLILCSAFIKCSLCAHSAQQPFSIHSSFRFNSFLLKPFGAPKWKDHLRKHENKNKCWFF